MGVRGLQFYLENCCHGASPNVSIPELVADARRNSQNSQPVIVVDGSSCIRILYGNLEWIGGGQLKQFGDKAQHFVRSFTDLGVRLVFFFDGPTVEEKRQTWVERRLNTMESMYYVLDAIEKGTPSHCIPKKHFHLPPGLGQLSRLIFEIVCGCEVFQSLTECDEEIAEYARTNHVFAILGQDTDFVILDGGEALYLSMQHLNLENMTTKLYDRWQLARSLKIHPTQLPLLATLMGNDIVPFDDLKKFHLYMTNTRNRGQKIDFRILVPNIAMYIRRLPPHQQHLYEILGDISYRVFGSPHRARDIRASLRSYEPLPARDYEREEQGRQDHWSRLVSEARRRHQRNQLPSMVYAIMSGLPFESSTSIEDFRRTDIPSFASATQEIRQRIYGILLQEKPLPPSGEHRVPEWCMAGPGSLDQANHVAALMPYPEHPGLMELWHNSRRYDEVRWRLFVHSVSPALDKDRIRLLPSYLVIPTLILFYINELDCLEEWEIDAMLATATCLRHYNVARLAEVPSDPIRTRGIRVANLIMRSTFVLYFLLAACGYPLTVQQSAPWLFFDGKLFQSKYIQAENRHSHEQLCDHRVDAIEDFQLARRIVFSYA